MIMQVVQRSEERKEKSYLGMNNEAKERETERETRLRT
jgi:hypothetical protein